MTNKYTREINGRAYIGVVISTGFGAGWSTWNSKLPTDPEVIEFLLGYVIEKDENSDDDWKVRIDEETLKEHYPNEYCGGADGLKICWVEEGNTIRIDEYDGNEFIEYLENSGCFQV